MNARYALANLQWAILTALLLLIAASRILRWDSLLMNPDEVWSIWQSVGSPLEIIRRTPYDWPPGYYLLMGFWQALVGNEPLLMRLPGMAAQVIGCAAIYRAGRRLTDHTGGLLCLSAFAALGLVTQVSLDTRGYALLLALYPLAFWFTLRYFDHPRWQRALPLALTIAACFYTSVTTIVLLLGLGLYTLLTQPRRVWRWIIPGGLALVLALPDLLSKFGVAGGRLSATLDIQLAPLPEALANLWWVYLGNAWPVLGLLLVLAAIGAWRGQGAARTAGLSLLLVIGGLPLLLYAGNRYITFFNGRYSSAMLPLIALTLGIGLALHARWIRRVSLLILTALLLVPIPQTGEYQVFGVNSPLQTNLEWLKTQLVPGDALMLAPDNECGKAEEWDYHLRRHFPTGLTFVNDPAGYRRIWYIARDRVPLEVEAGRLPGRFVGPPGCLFRVYEAPPDSIGLLFENGMRFHGLDIMEGDLPWSAPVVRREGESVTVRLWWSADRPIDRDYSAGLYILLRDQVVAQVDAPPQLTQPPGSPPETSRWQPGQLYSEVRTLVLPFPTARGAYGLNLTVYFWADDERVNAPGMDADRLLFLRPFQVMSY
jgi:Dolichyl-phosphate-mannose-protein mannosyltransferase